MVAAITHKPQRDRASGFLLCFKGKLWPALPVSLTCEAGMTTCKVLLSDAFVMHILAWTRGQWLDTLSVAVHGSRMLCH